ncbi:hypothetical protein BGZ96_003629 [Linnemannia gamsii]|uniref:Tropomyosin n=1 Tax=Linnemannia gamsii TaxID=64522 RepID=A0ABQ7KF12_9FUNG|nr:hypothetical protein BGZ96_003629 [Linnemannia gamsii]
MEAFKKKLETLRGEADAALSRAETAERELAAAKADNNAKDQEAISHNNRISLLETQLEKAETGGSDSKTKLRELELKVEDLDRKIKTLEKENESLENKLESMTEKHNIAKAELEETLKAMDEM